jgi:hypothetical protein
MTTAADAGTLRDALRLAEEISWAVLPLHTAPGGACTCSKGAECGSPGKHPRTMHGTADATTDPAVIRGWWKEWPNANPAIATGAEHGLFMVGPDGTAGIAALAELERQHGALPLTPRAGSGSEDPGEHYYFVYPPGAVITNARNHRGLPIDVRGDGGLAVAPPSLHKSGRHYEWIVPPWETPLAQAPAWLIDWCQKEHSGPAPSAHAGNGACYGAAGPDVTKRVLAYLAKCPPAVSGCGGHNQTFAVARAVVYGFNLGPEAGYRLLAEAYNPFCRPPWSEKELLHKCHDANTKPCRKPRGWLLDQPPPESNGVHRARVPRPMKPSGNGTADHDADTEHDGPPPEPTQKPQGDAPAGGVSLADFYAYLPQHAYLFVPSRQMWPGGSINARFGKLGSGQSMISASTWLDRNRAVEQMTWMPGEPLLIKNKLISAGGWIDRSGCTCFNLYLPPQVESGDRTKAGPWIDHLQAVYPDDAPHILAWLAHRVQRPAEKINHALVLGGAQGIGKDTLLEPVKSAVGPWNFIEVSPHHLMGRFNGFVKSVVLRVSEARDLGDVDRYAFYEHMKVYTAAPPDVLRVDEKHLRENEVPNVCGVIITTNHKTAGIYLPPDDRRHYVAWSERDRNDFPADYWNQLHSWYAAGGRWHVAAYLAAHDLSVFNPKAPPPHTAAWWGIVDANQAPEDAELADVLDELNNPAAVTIAQLAERAGTEFRAWLTDRKNRRAIPHRLENASYVPVHNELAKDGLWKVNGKRQVIYAQSTLSPQERQAVAKAIAGAPPGL